MRPSSRGIDIVAFSGRRVWSRVIELRSLSQFSHVGIVCEIDGDDWVIEALEGKGVRLVPLRCWMQWDGEFKAFALADPESGIPYCGVLRQRVINFAAKRIGQEYASPLQLVRSFGFVTRWLCRVLRLRVDLEADRWFCSELVAAALYSAGLFIPRDAAQMAPGDVVRLPFLKEVS